MTTPHRPKIIKPTETYTFRKYLKNSNMMIFSELEKVIKTFTAYVEYDSATKLYIGIVPRIPGAHTQGASLDELQENFKEVLELCLAE